MATITLKNIPAELHRELKKRAEENHRSLNKEIIATLKSAASGTHRVDVESWMTREARAARAKFTAPDQRSLRSMRWKRAGRP